MPTLRIYGVGVVVSTSWGCIDKSRGDRHFPGLLGYESAQFLKENPFEESTFPKIFACGALLRVKYFNLAAPQARNFWYIRPLQGDFLLENSEIQEFGGRGGGGGRSRLSDVRFSKPQVYPPPI